MKRTLAAILLSCSLIGSVHATDLIDVIVSKKTAQIEKIERITINELIDIFTRKRTIWNSGTEIIVVTRRLSSPEHMEFLYNKIGITPFQYRNRLNRNVYKGKARAPIEVDTDEEVIDYILRTDGSIGYVSNSYILQDSGTLYVVDG